jgi:hypothetical protein
MRSALGGMTPPAPSAPYLCVCVCVCEHACMRAYVSACTRTREQTRVCVCARKDDQKEGALVHSEKRSVRLSAPPSQISLSYPKSDEMMSLAFSPTDIFITPSSCAACIDAQMTTDPLPLPTLPPLPHATPKPRVMRQSHERLLA